MSRNFNLDRTPTIMTTRPFLATIAGSAFVCLPFSMRLNSDGTLVSISKPGLVMLRDVDNPTAWRIDYVESEAAKELIWSYHAISGFYDDSSGTVYLVYNWRDDSTGENRVRRSCMKGFIWSAPVDVYSTPTDESIETVAAGNLNGQLGIIIQNTTGTAPLEDPHYHQSELGCSAAGIPSSGVANSVWLASG
jgi:hypothetical protein